MTRGVKMWTAGNNEGMERFTGRRDGWTNTKKRWREDRKDGRIKDLHSKANTRRERDDRAGEIESLRGAGWRLSVAMHRLC